MSISEAINYCYSHLKEYLADGNTQREFDCLITAIQNGYIKPHELSDYGMEF